MIYRKFNKTLSRQTIYDWVEKGIIKYNKKKIKKKKTPKLTLDSTQQMINKIERLKGREYKDFIEYTKENNNSIITEIDLVEGIKGSDTYLFTMFIPSIQFIFIFKIKNKYPTSVAKVFDWIEKRIGHKNFKRLFGVLLADQGSEFLNHEIITKSIYDSYTRRCKIFYCEAGKPHQKSPIELFKEIFSKIILDKLSIEEIACEDIHRILRRYIPKGVDLSNYS